MAVCICSSSVGDATGVGDAPKSMDVFLAGPCSLEASEYADGLRVGVGSRLESGGIHLSGVALSALLRDVGVPERGEPLTPGIRLLLP